MDIDSDYIIKRWRRKSARCGRRQTRKVFYVLSLSNINQVLCVPFVSSLRSSREKTIKYPIIPAIGKKPLRHVHQHIGLMPLPRLWLTDLLLGGVNTIPSIVREGAYDFIKCERHLPFSRDFRLISFFMKLLLSV